ncbi:MAG: hypothetical protein AAF355_11955 [Myxococcota bacterium]
MRDRRNALLALLFWTGCSDSFDEDRPPPPPPPPPLDASVVADAGAAPCTPGSSVGQTLLPIETQIQDMTLADWGTFCTWEEVRFEPVLCGDIMIQPLPNCVGDLSLLSEEGVFCEVTICELEQCYFDTYSTCNRSSCAQVDECVVRAQSL